MTETYVTKFGFCVNENNSVQTSLFQFFGEQFEFFRCDNDARRLASQLIVCFLYQNVQVSSYDLKERKIVLNCLLVTFLTDYYQKAIKLQFLKKLNWRLINHKNVNKNCWYLLKTTILNLLITRVEFRFFATDNLMFITRFNTTSI